MANERNFKFSNSHEWVEFLDDTTARVGLTDYAQSHIGDMVFINLPDVGDEVEKGTAACDVESVKAVFDVNSPVTGTICEANEELADNPAKINEAAYDAWIFKVENITEIDDLMDYDAYEAFCEEEEE